MVLVARAQQDSPQGILELWSDFGESLGSLPMVVTARLFPFYWTLFWIGDLETAMIAVYLAITVAVFVAVYLTARFVSATRGTALLAAWALCLLMMPIVPQPVLFYHLLLWSGPPAVTTVVVPLIVFALVPPLRILGLLPDPLCGICL